LNKRPSRAKHGLNELQSPSCPVISFEKHSFGRVFGYLQLSDVRVKLFDLGFEMADCDLTISHSIAQLVIAFLSVFEFSLNMWQSFERLGHLNEIAYEITHCMG
jgi:hypothetical protein